MSFDNIWQWSETAASNTAIASTDITGATGKVKDGDNAIRAMMSQIITMEGKGTDVASAGTVTLGTERYYHITGTTTITDVDFTDAVDGRWAWLIFDGALTLTHNATSLKLPGGENITTAAGDRALFVQDNSNNVICLAYQQAANLTNVLSGTWTPTMTFNGSSSGVTYSIQEGYYVKTGPLVHAYGRITLTSNGSGVGDARIASFPFASLSSGSGPSSMGQVRLRAGGSAATGIYIVMISGGTTGALFIPGAASDAAASDTNVTNTFACDFSVTYQAS